MKISILFILAAMLPASVAFAQDDAPFDTGKGIVIHYDGPSSEETGFREAVLEVYTDDASYKIMGLWRGNNFHIRENENFRLFSMAPSDIMLYGGHVVHEYRIGTVDVATAKE